MLTLACSIFDAGFDDTIRTTIYTGRPARTYASPYVREWETTRLSEQRAVMAKGIIPLHYDIKRYEESGGMPKNIEYEAQMK
jgi:NAD(P)H-dependent flavin oxidoreductase YrpB (nitropropane dioxygenase family)